MLDARTDTKPGVSLAICIPSNGVWTADFGMSISQMLVFMASQPFENDQERFVHMIDKRSSNLPRVRQECLEDAILKGCTHALFVDTDQSFPHDTAHRLLAAKKAVIGANIALKSMPSFPTARARAGSPFGAPITSNGKKGLEKVWRVGSGILLVDLELVKTINRPWFAIEYDHPTGQFMGEDWYFLKKLEEAGADIWIDHDLSNQVGHVGQFVYGHPHIPALEMEAAA